MAMVARRLRRLPQGLLQQAASRGLPAGVPMLLRRRRGDLIEKNRLSRYRDHFGFDRDGVSNLD
jgi:hypothetical protein